MITLTNLKNKGICAAAVIAFVSGITVAGSLVNVSADSVTASGSTTTTTTTSGSSTSTSTKTSTKAAVKATNEQTHINNIITKGNEEIERRLTSLATLSTKISDAKHLTSADQAALSSEVSSTTSGLTALKSQLDSATTITAAASDAQDIYTEYRVYALVLPKVQLVKVADDEQVVASKLASMSQKLQTRITADQTAGKNVSALQSELTTMESDTTTAQGIASNIESSVINLVPSDYNSNHAVLEGDNTQLQTARGDLQSAYTDAKNITSSLKSL